MGEEANSKMGIKVHDKILCLDLFWMVTKDGGDDKIPITNAALQGAGTNAVMNDSFKNAKILYL